jgi:hypothetical protein
MNYSCISTDAADSDTGSSGMLGTKRRRGEKLGSDAEGQKALLSERQTAV